MNKDNPFKVPEEYFGEFNHRLMEKLSAEGQLLPKKDGFAVPDAYFDTLHERVVQKMESIEPQVVQLNPYKKYYLAAASIAALVLMVFMWPKNTTEVPTFESLGHAEIDAFFENNDFGLSMYEIVEEIPIGNLEIADFIENHLGENSLEDYIHENTDDLESLNLDYDE